MTPALPTFQPIEDGDVLPMLGGLRVIHTPGHTPGSVCLYGAATASCSWATPCNDDSAGSRTRAACTATTTRPRVGQ